MTATAPVLPLAPERFRLAKMLGAGDDGVSYAGREGYDGPLVVLHRLKRLQFERRRWFEQRLKKRALVDGLGFLALHHSELDGNEPVLVTERVDGSLAQLFAGERLQRDVALKVLASLADVLAHAHRVGLTHGNLSPHAVFLRDDFQVALELLQPVTGSVPFDARCRAPDETDGPGADLYALGSLMSLCLSGAPPPKVDETATAAHGVAKDDARILMKELLDPEPSWRPSAADARDRLARLLAGASVPLDEHPTLGGEGEPRQLGRFALEALIGRGAMGRVYRAVDLSDGKKVALKLLDGQTSLTALRRFRKEARLLSEVNNPFIANLIETNRDQGLYFMAVELVEGRDLNALLKEKGPFAENEAVAIAADVTRALVEVHSRGIIHRDIKPANVVLVSDPNVVGRVKLIDFGIARHVDEHASLQLTEAGAAVGTPVYMSPEQCKGEPLDGKSDVYSLAVTLFTLMSGKPPFTAQGDNPEGILSRHLFEVPPLLTDVVAAATPGLAALVARCLDKDPSRRPDAEELLHELDRLLSHEVTRIDAHPAPPHNESVVTYRFEWLLKSPPADLWGYVANTDRVNRAIGLGPVEESFRVVEGEVQRLGRSKQGPFTLAWREHPFEWVHGKRLGVLRELDEGPLRWLRNIVELEPSGPSGTRLVHTIEIEPRGVVGRAAAAVEIGVRTRLALGRVYQRIDELLTRPNDRAAVIAGVFEPGFQLEPERDARLAAIEQRMVEQGADVVATARLGDFLRHAPEAEVARIRPLKLAKVLSLDAAQLVTTCMWAAREGSLTLGWDLVCPACRAPSQMKDTLRAVKEHGRCEVCSIDYALDLASSVELVFQAHDAIRVAERRTFCLGSPGHVPHVAAQVRMKPGERFEVALKLDEGRYQLAGRHLAYTLEFRVGRGAGTHRWEIALSKGLRPELPRSLDEGTQTIVLENDTGREQLVRIERAMAREDALTAAKVASLPLFRRLFPMEVLSPGQLVSVSNVALLMVEVAPSADEPATDSGSFAGRYAMFRRLEEKAASEGGSVVKIAGDGVVAVFSDVAAAVRAAFKLGDDPLPLRVAVHKGPAAAVTLDEHLDYFGRTVRETARLLTCGEARELVLSEAAASDPAVAVLVALRSGEARVDARFGIPCQHFSLT